MKFPVEIELMILDCACQEDQLKWAIVCKAWFKHIVKKIKPQKNQDDGNVYYMAVHNCCIDVINSENWNTGLDGAIRGKHWFLAKIMINRGATNWVMHMQNICENNRLDLVNIIQNKIQTKQIQLSKFQVIRIWNSGLYGACRRNYFRMTKIMIKLGATDLIGAFKMARYSRNKKMIQFILQQKINSINWDSIINYKNDYGIMEFLKDFE